MVCRIFSHCSSFFPLLENSLKELYIVPLSFKLLPHQTESGITRTISAAAIMITVTKGPARQVSGATGGEIGGPSLHGQ